jgi:hypothetical protein
MGDRTWRVASSAEGATRIWNQYFEVMPIQYVPAIVTDRGLVSIPEFEDSKVALPPGSGRALRRRDGGIAAPSLQTGAPPD